MAKSITPRTTTTSRSSTVKTGTEPTVLKPTVVKAVKPVAPAAVPVDPQLSLPELKKVELVEKAVERSGVKKRYVKPAIEAALAILGEALLEERNLNLQPMGKVMVKNSKDAGSGNVINARIRQSKRAGAEAKEVLADPAE